MKIETAINHKNTLKRRVNDASRQAKIYEWTSDQLMSTVHLNVYGYEPLKAGRLPRWVREYISGYKDCLWEMHWQHVEWVFPWNGKIYKNWDKLHKRGREHYMQKDVTGLHVYKSDNWKHYTGTADQFKAGVKDAGDQA